MFSSLDALGSEKHVAGFYVTDQQDDPKVPTYQYCRTAPSARYELSGTSVQGAPRGCEGRAPQGPLRTTRDEGTTGEENPVDHEYVFPTPRSAPFRSLGVSGSGHWARLSHNK